MKNFYLVCLTLISFGITAADVSVEKMSDIESRVGSMSLSELQDRRSLLIREEGQLMATQTSTQNPSTIKSVSSRLAEIRAELSALQKALLAIVGAASINALTDDGYNDNVPPVITVNGSNPVTVELGTTYSDAGATANDAFHGTTPVTSTGSVDTSVVGSYTISYSATDLDGNTATASRTVNVVDTTAPVVTVTGDDPVSVELGETYTDAGATATDASGEVEVVTSGSVDTDTVGEYTLTYTATDASENAGTDSRTVNVVDTTAPVITSSATFVVDEGVTAIGSVTATDLATVTYTIGATSSPAILGNGAASQLEINSSTGQLTFNRAPDYDVQVPDVQLYAPADLFGTVTKSTMTLSGYETGATMDFTATVTVTDASGNTTTQDITVSVRDVGGVDDDTGTGTGTGVGTGTGTTKADDTTAPVITVTGDNPATTELGDTYTDAGATATDSDGPTVENITVVTSGTVDTDTLGEYTLTYTATDRADNVATATRTVNVVDTTAPVFTSQETYIVDEGVTAIGLVTATDLTEVTYTIGETTGPEILGNGTPSKLVLNTQNGVSAHLNFDRAPDYDVQVPDVQLYAPADAFGTVTKSTKTLSGYETGATMDFTATVTATDSSGNTTTQDITVSVRDVGGVDDDTGTGTGTGTGVGTGTLADGVVEIPQFISQDTFVVNEGVTAIGLVTATIPAGGGTDVTMTYTIGDTTGPATLGNQAASKLVLRTQNGKSAHLNFDRAPDYDSQVPDTTLWDTSLRNANCPQTNGSEICYETERAKTLSGYETGATMDFTATVTATSSIGTINTQTITVQVRDVGGVDDDTGTGTGTGTGVGTGTGTATNLSDTTGGTGQGVVSGG